jgi:hypothetical protein
MTDTKPEFVFTIPPVACLFGEREHVLQLFPPGWTNQHEEWAEASILVAADNAARAIAGRGLPPFPSMTCEAGDPEHQQARAALQAYLMASAPEVIIVNLRQAAERHQRNEFGRMVGQPVPFDRPVLIFHLDSEAEFALVQQLAPGAIAVEIVARQPISEATQAREGWPARRTKIGARPDCPSWVSTDAREHFNTWAKLARQRVLSLARASLADGVMAL